MDRHFENGDIEEKRLIVSSMFPDFLEFYGTRHRTPKLNSAIALIYQDNSKLQGKKNGTSLSFLDLSLPVTPLRLELRTHRLRAYRSTFVNKVKNLCFLLARAIYVFFFSNQNLAL